MVWKGWSNVLSGGVISMVPARTLSFSFFGGIFYRYGPRRLGLLLLWWDLGEMLRDGVY